MCVIYMIRYSCDHCQFLDYPLVTACMEMAEASTPNHPVYCPTETLQWEFSSDNICATCSRRMYLLEKRYLITKAVNKALLDGGGRSSSSSSSDNNNNNRQPALEPLSPAEAKNWLQWLSDRERFRQIGVRGGKHGELGQGWRTKKVCVDGRDFYREAGKEWMSERYGPGVMLGWEDVFTFDEYLGEMGDWDLKGGPRGLQRALLGAQLRETEKGEMVVLDFDDVVD